MNIIKCPNCHCEIDKKKHLKGKLPFSDIINIASWFSYMNRLENFDLIECPCCKFKFKSDEVKLFGFMTARQLKILLVIYFGAAILFAIFELIRNIP